MKRRAYKFRLKPDAMQINLLSQFAGCARFVFNYFLAREQESYEQTGKMLGYHKAAQTLVQLKKESTTSFLKAPHSQILQQKLQDLYQAFENFFKKRASYPRFKKRGRSDSFRYPQGFEIDQKNRVIYLPKIGFINYYHSRDIVGNPKNITISCKAGKWYCSIQTEEEFCKPENKGSMIGIDLGITRLATLSD